MFILNTWRLSISLVICFYCFNDNLICLLFNLRYVCHRRRDHLEKSKGTLHSPQGPLWKRFTQTRLSPDGWVKTLAPVNWRCCTVCKANPFEVWKKSGAWDLFHTAKTAMQKIELDSQKNVLLETVSSGTFICGLVVPKSTSFFVSVSRFHTKIEYKLLGHCLPYKFVLIIEVTSNQNQNNEYKSFFGFQGLDVSSDDDSDGSDEADSNNNSIDNDVDKIVDKMAMPPPPTAPIARR